MAKMPRPRPRPPLRGERRPARAARRLTQAPPVATLPERGGAAAARRAHNPKVGGSNPSPATKISIWNPVARPGFVILRLFRQAGAAFREHLVQYSGQPSGEIDPIVDTRSRRPALAIAHSQLDPT